MRHILNHQRTKTEEPLRDGQQRNHWGGGGGAPNQPAVDQPSHPAPPRFPRHPAVRPARKIPSS